VNNTLELIPEELQGQQVEEGKIHLQEVAQGVMYLFKLNYGKVR
jgi:hypothetical protein